MVLCLYYFGYFGEELTVRQVKAMKGYLKKWYIPIVILNKELDEFIVVGEALDLSSVRIHYANVS